jgi:hypothetical protein
MKKNILLGFAVMFFAAAQAQEATSSEPVVLKSKKGINILPEAGEWGLGISANPFLNYAGNFLNGNTFNGSPAFNYVSNPANNVGLFGKYVIDANTAYRVRFNAGVGTQVDKAVIAQNEVTPDVNYPAFTEDFRKTSSQTILLAAGYEKRRGKSRVQGVYGGELVLGYTGAKQTYEYGNAISQDFNAPITNNFGSNILAGTTAAASSRVIEQKSGASYYVGARGFIGVEYFIGPKVSIGGEFGYSLAFRSASRTLVTSERWDGLSNSRKEVKTDVGTPANYFTFIGTSLDNLSGSVNLLFYF